MKAHLELVKIFNATSSFKEFWNTKYHQNEPKFITYNLPKLKHGGSGINLDKYKSIGTHWIALYVSANDVVYFDSFGVEHTPEKIPKISWETKI